MRNLFLVIALASGEALAFPQGVSYWEATGQCDAACRAQGHSAGSAQIVLIVRGQRVCGEIQQDHAARDANRSPSGKIAGRIVRGAAIVGYTDSFGDPKYPGVASLNLNRSRLRWTTVMTTPVGYLHPDPFLFRRGQHAPVRIVAHRTDKEEIARSCSEYFDNPGNDPAREHLERQ